MQPQERRLGAVGVELEMAVASLRDLSSHPVDLYFERLLRRREARVPGQKLKRAEDGRALGVLAGTTFSSIDNAFNNLETAIGPLAGPDALFDLDTLMKIEMEDAVATLQEENAGILNFSEHPAGTMTQAFYKAVRAPKPIYDYWVGHRGWQHWVGIDAKAQNGPNVDVRPGEAIRALNAILALSPVFIALFGNSPFEAGQLTGNKENRLTIWPRMFASCRFPADFRLQAMPERPFHDMRDHFEWMFGGDTAMQIIPGLSGHDYKGMSNVLRIDGDPAALDFLKGGATTGISLATGLKASVTPSVDHIEFLQFSHFLDARFRWRFRESPDVEHFLAAFHVDGGLEDLFERTAAASYIEVRPIGANFPDAELVSTAPADAITSQLIAPVALSKAWLSELDSVERLVSRVGWPTLRALRAEAIRHGLAASANGVQLSALAAEAMEIATDAVNAAEQWTLGYPRHVVKTGLSGADRALRQFERRTGDRASRIAAITRDRFAVIPAGWRMQRASVSQRREVAPAA
jgi:gamma-glutamylcysteine synthetase